MPNRYPSPFLQQNYLGRSQDGRYGGGYDQPSGPQRENFRDRRSFGDGQNDRTRQV